MGLGSPAQNSVLGVPFGPTNHRQDADATKNRGQDARATQGQDALATAAKALFAHVQGSVRISDPKTINLRLNPNYFEPRTLINLLRKIFAEKK